MALEVLTVEYTTTSDGITDHSTVYATRVVGDFWEDEDGARGTGFTSDSWRVGDSALWVYPDEVDAYIELFQKIKATAE